MRTFGERRGEPGSRVGVTKPAAYQAEGPASMSALRLEKSEWGPGPWQDEPDRVEWRHAGLPCLVRRSPMGGNWCGYVAVPPGHPLHGADYDTPGVDVHGGLTYAAACDGSEGVGICHVPREGEPADVWWLAFDCHHLWDIAPCFLAEMARIGIPQHRHGHEVYRDLAYVTAETNRLADQLAELAP